MQTNKKQIYPIKSSKAGAKQLNGVYLDYAASTPIDQSVLRAMLPYFREEYGNPSSIHGFGQRALAAIDEAREKVAAFLGSVPSEVIFTGSATEANNLAIQGVVRSSQSAVNGAPHIITSQIEHDSVLEVCRQLEKEGVEVTYLPVTKEGLVLASDLEKALKHNTILVSIMYANNEIGTIQPIAETANIIKNENTKRHTLSAKHPRIIFHTDAVQAANYLNCNIDKLGVDLLTLSAHKIYGPKGVGALYIRKGTVLRPLISGGGQEFNLRPGTENVAGIVGFGAAITQVTRLRQGYGGQAGNKLPAFAKAAAGKQVTGITSLRDMLINKMLKNIPRARLNGSAEIRLANNANFCFPGVDAESLIIALDQKGIAVSSGSACSTRAIKPSHVLRAIGLSDKDARSSVRFSLGRYSTAAEINYLMEILPSAVKNIKTLS